MGFVWWCFQDTAHDWMSTKLSYTPSFTPWWNEQHNPIWWYYICRVHGQKWSEARLRTCPNPVWYFLFTSMVSGHQQRVCIFTHNRMVNCSMLQGWRPVPRPQKCLLEICFADNAVLAAHSESHLQKLMDHFAVACKLFGLTISLKKTQVMGQGTTSPPSIHIIGQQLEVQ